MDNLAMDFSLEDECYWDMLPENILLHVFSYLPAQSLLKASLVCRCWNRVAFDELLWKDLFYRHWKIDRVIGMAPGHTSWYQEYKRLYYRVPCMESEVINKHADQVLHVSFSHNGKMFSTCSKDGFIKVWNASYPVTLRYKYSMKELAWKYTQYSQFNENDTLLLVSGVHFGPNSTSGEIAVFSLTDEFEMQARVINKPYDVFGTWYNNDYLLSGNLYWTGQLQSCSALWLNKAYQATESEHESVVMRLYRFHNVNASSIRTVMIAKCLKDQENNNMCQCQTHCCQSQCCGAKSGNISTSKGDQKQNNYHPSANPDITLSNGVLDGTSEHNVRQSDSVCQKIQHLTMFEDGSFRTRMIAVDSDHSSEKLNGTFEYSLDYRAAEGSSPPSNADITACSSSDSLSSYSPMPDVKSEENASSSSRLKRTYGQTRDSKGQIVRKGSEGKMMKTSVTMDEKSDQNQDESCDTDATVGQESFADIQARQDSCPCVLHRAVCSDSSMQSVDSSQALTDPEEWEVECSDHCSHGMYLDGSVNGYPLQSNFFLGSDHNHAVLEWNPYSSLHEGDTSVKYSLDASSSKCSNNKRTALMEEENLFPDKYLIFTMGERTYTPHQIGIKRIKAVEKITQDGVQVLPDVEENLHGMDRVDYDTVDHTIDLHGHIIGMCLSPDHRYLYVNSRPWPKNYHIENVLYPPPIAQEIDIHVIDLMKMTEVGKMYQSHKAYTPNDECFFIFLDVCESYVASGAEDKHGYIWDRHYGICLNKFPHGDVVNCVAFNPKDSEVLVTVSDDQSIRVWRSRHREKHVKKMQPPSWCYNS